MPVSKKIRDLLTYAAPANVTVQTTTGIVVLANSSRKFLCLTNTGSNPIYLAFGHDAVASKGIPLLYAGSTFVLHGMNLFTGNIHAITTGGTSNMAIQEATQFVSNITPQGV